MNTTMITNPGKSNPKLIIIDFLVCDSTPGLHYITLMFIMLICLFVLDAYCGIFGHILTR